MLTRKADKCLQKCVLWTTVSMWNCFEHVEATFHWRVSWMNCFDQLVSLTFMLLSVRVRASRPMWVDCENDFESHFMVLISHICENTDSVWYLVGKKWFSKSYDTRYGSFLEMMFFALEFFLLIAPRKKVNKSQVKFFFLSPAIILNNKPWECTRSTLKTGFLRPVGVSGHPLFILAPVVCVYFILFYFILFNLI